MDLVAQAGRSLLHRRLLDEDGCSYRPGESPVPGQVRTVASGLDKREYYTSNYICHVCKFSCKTLLMADIPFGVEYFAVLDCR